MISEILHLKRSKNVSLFLFCIILASACLHTVGEKGVAKAQSRPVSPERADAKWTRMGGTWNIKDGRAIESRGIPVIWDFHELVNYNSLASLPEKNVSPFTEMSSKFSLSNVKSNVVEVLLAFALQSPQASYYYNFYAVRFALAKDGVQTASVIRSQRLDETLPFTAKKNYSIETLFVTDCTLEFNRDHEVRIVKSTGAWHETLKKRCDVITLFIDGKKIFNVKLHDNDVRGNFAVGARGASISLDHVTVKNRNAIVFADDFSKNSIFTTTVRAVEVR